MSKFALRKQSENILSEEVAVEQVVSLLEYYDIDVESLPEEAKDNIERALENLTKYVKRGIVEIELDTDSKITVTQNVKGVSPIVYSELSARHKLAMDRAKGDGGYTRIYALMGSLCGLGAEAINKLPARDLAIVECLGVVFLAA